MIRKKLAAMITLSLIMFLCTAAGAAASAPLTEEKTSPGNYVYYNDFEGTVFRYNGNAHDLSEFVDAPARQILDVRLLDDMAIIHGLTKDDHEVYYYYLISDDIVEFHDQFSNLIWKNDDFSTRAYSYGNTVCRLYDEVLGSTRGNIISMEFGQDGTSIICETEPYTFDLTYKLSGRGKEIINCNSDETNAAIEEARLRIMDDISRKLPDDYVMNQVTDDFDNDGQYEMFFITWNHNDELTPSDIPKSHHSSSVRYCAMRYYDDGEIMVLPQNERFLFLRPIKRFSLEDGTKCVYIESYINDSHWDAGFYTVDGGTPRHIGTLVNGYVTGNRIYEGSLTDDRGYIVSRGGVCAYRDGIIVRN